MELNIIPLGGYQANCYCLTEGDDLCLIDPGDEAPKVLKHLKDLGKTPKYILLTHGHYDHTGAVETLVKDYPEVKVYLHKGDQNDVLQLFPINSQNVPLLAFEDGDKLPFGQGHILVHSTPGHSEGSVVLEYQDCLFTGDTLFYGSMGRTDFQGGNYDKMMKSLKKIAQFSGDYKVYPGHDRSSSLDAERNHNAYIQEALRS